MKRILSCLLAVLMISVAFAGCIPDVVLLAIIRKGFRKFCFVNVYANFKRRFICRVENLFIYLFL